MDLSTFFFYFGLHPSVRRWVRIKKEIGDFQWTGLPFGLHASPYWTGRPVQVAEKLCYVDDLLLLGDSQGTIPTKLEVLFQKYIAAGLILKKTKSQFSPIPKVKSLCQQINLRDLTMGPQSQNLSRGLEITKVSPRRRKSSRLYSEVSAMPWLHPDLAQIKTNCMIRIGPEYIAKSGPEVDGRRGN